MEEGFEPVEINSRGIPKFKDNLVLFRVPKDIDISLLKDVRIKLSDKSQTIETGDAALVLSSEKVSPLLRPLVFGSDEAPLVGRNFQQMFSVSFDFSSKILPFLNASLEEKTKDIPIEKAYEKVHQLPEVKANAVKNISGKKRSNEVQSNVEESKSPKKSHKKRKDKSSKE